MITPKRLISILLPLCLMLSACRPDFEPAPPSTISHNLSMINSSYRLGHTLLNADTEHPNQLNSPISLMLGLGMLAEGTSDEARQEIEAAIGCSSEEISALIQGLRPLEKNWESVDPGGELDPLPVLHIANRIVLDDELKARRNFRDDLARYHDASIEQTDLSSPEATKMLDAWVKKHTAGLIEKSAIEPKEDLALVLQNALLMAAMWQEPFKASDTEEGEFTTAGGQAIQVPFLHGDQTVSSTSSNGWQAIRMPYMVRFAANFLLPPEGTDPRSLSPEELRQMLIELRSTKEDTVQVAIPKLDLKVKMDLEEGLKAAGINKVFDAQTDPFSRITEETPLKLGQAMQQTRLLVDEQGTIAAAATEVGVEFIAAPVPAEASFIADRPFLMVISDDDLDMPFFMISVGDPSQ